MIRSILIFSCAFILMASISCRKDEHNHELVQQAKIDINSPPDRKLYSKGDTVHIDAKITSAEGIHGYSVQILSPSGAILYSTEEHTHGTDVVVNKQWMFDAEFTVGDTLTMTVKAVISHEGESIEKVKNILVK